MQPEELDAIAETIVDTVKSHVAPLVQRLDAIVAREPVVGPTGPAGKDGRDGADAPVVDVLDVAKQAAALMPTPTNGRDGIDADADLIAAKVMAIVAEQLGALVSREVEKAVSAIEKPKDGRDGKDGLNGRDATVEELAPLVSVEVAKAVDKIERPKDGQNGRDGTDGHDGQDGQSVALSDIAGLVSLEVTKAIDALPRPKDGEPGRDGVGLAGALLDNAGQLVLTLSNGIVQPLGRVVGEKGIDGKAGRDGKDGADGLGFDDLSVEHDGERTMAVTLRQGERVKSFPVAFPVQIHRGVFEVSKTYERGDCTTWGGSTWQAVRPTSGLKPGDGAVEKTGWVLVTKAGRDGRSGKDGEPGKPGRDGRDGGAKW